MSTELRPSRRSMLIVAIGAILAHVWCLALPFQADDFILIREAPSLVGLETTPTPPPSVAPDLLDNTYLFRPTTWVLWTALTGLGGGTANPDLFHVVSILFKALSAVLLLRVLRRCGLSPWSATSGTLLFAMFPGSLQATTWISAQGDQLAVLFTAWVGYHVVASRSEGESWRHVTCVALGTALAVASKDVALATFPALAVAWWLAPGTTRRMPWRLIAAIGLAILAVFAARAAYLGTWSPRYLSAVALRVEDLLRIPRIFGHALAYWNSDQVFSELAPMLATVLTWMAGNAELARTWLLYLSPLIFLIATCRSTMRSHWKLHVAMAGALFAVLVPPILVFTDSGAHSISRVYEPVAAVLAAWLAIGLHLIESRTTVKQRLVRLLPLMLLCLDFGIHIARTELCAGRHVESRLESLQQIVATAPPGTRVAVIDREANVGGIPSLYFTVGFATRPPFLDPPIDTVWWPSRKTLQRVDSWFRFPGPVMIVEASNQTLGYVPVGSPLPALSHDQPNLKAIGSTTWKLSKVTNSRASEGLFALATWPGRERVSVKVRWRGPEGTATTEAAFLGGRGAVPIAIPSPADFVMSWTDLEIETQATLTDVRLGSYPLIEVRDPKEGDVRSAWPLESMTIRGADDAPGLRFTVELVLDDDLTRPRIILKATSDRLTDAGGGWRTFDPNRATDVTVEGMVGGAAALVPILEKRMAWSGAKRVRAAIRVEGIDWWTGMTIARSTWTSFSLSELAR